MENKISFFALAVVLLFTSCTKEVILEPQINTVQQEEGLLPFPSAANTPPSYGAGTRSTTLQIDVAKVSVQEASGELLLLVSCSYNLTGVTLENSQTLRFEDASGSESILTFSVNNALGTNGQLNSNFAIGGNDLTGLTLKVAQDIIIVDDFIN